MTSLPSQIKLSDDATIVDGIPSGAVFHRMAYTAERPGGFDMTELYVHTVGRGRKRHSQYYLAVKPYEGNEACWQINADDAYNVNAVLEKLEEEHQAKRDAEIAAERAEIDASVAEYRNEIRPKCEAFYAAALDHIANGGNVIVGSMTRPMAINDPERFKFSADTCMFFVPETPRSTQLVAAPREALTLA